MNKMEMELQDTENPIELLTKRFNYHIERMENSKYGSERYRHHKQMARIYAKAGDMLSGKLSTVLMLEHINGTLERNNEILDRIVKKGDE